MKHSFTQDRKNLIIEIDKDEIQELVEMGEEIHSDRAMFDFFEKLICNSELEWIPERATGDLTNAPMLGIYEYDPELNSGDGEHFLSEHWAFMSYEVVSVLEILRDNGKAVFVS